MRGAPEKNPVFILGIVETKSFTVLSKRTTKDSAMKDYIY